MESEGLERIVHLAALLCLFVLEAKAIPAEESHPPPRFITSGSDFTDYWPSFSPEGKAVLFSRKFALSDAWELWLVPADGGEARRLAATPLPVSATRANWSRDGQLIAFTGTKAGKNSVWVINADGRDAHELSVPGLSEQMFYPSWYPKGAAIAAMDGKALAIVSIDLRSSTSTVLTNPKEIFTGMPNVSPDGSAIVFAGQANQGQPYDQGRNVIWVLSVSDRRFRALEPNVPQQGRAPTWSPDGTRIAFESKRGSLLGEYAVFLEHIDGSGVTRITDYALNATHPVWSPDGKGIAFAARDQFPSKGLHIAVLRIQ